MKILKYPDPILLIPCKEVEVFDDGLQSILDLMYEAMIREKGMGIAANQVGISMRAFIMVNKEKERIDFINPVIRRKSEVSSELAEGCLSAPGEFLQLDERAEWVQVEFSNPKGERQTRVFSGIQAVCVQHEIDHLDGKTHLLSPTLNSADRKRLARKWGLKVK